MLKTLYYLRLTIFQMNELNSWLCGLEKPKWAWHYQAQSAWLFFFNGKLSKEVDLFRFDFLREGLSVPSAETIGKCHHTRLKEMHLKYFPRPYLEPASHDSPVQ